jgi:hypothetical protein
MTLCDIGVIVMYSTRRASSISTTTVCLLLLARFPAARAFFLNACTLAITRG